MVTTPKTQRFREIVAAATALAAGSALAHHSANMFDRARARTIEGTVKEFQWTNPHAWLQVNTVDEQGKAIEWSVELGGINSLGRNGYRPSTFKPGDAVAVHLAPHVDGVPAGLYIGARLADGSVLGRMP